MFHDSIIDTWGKLGDAKTITGSCMSKTYRQYNGIELRRCKMESSFLSTSRKFSDTLVKNLSKSRERQNTDGIVASTKGTYMSSSMTHL